MFGLFPKKDKKSEGAPVPPTPPMVPQVQTTAPAALRPPQPAGLKPAPVAARVGTTQPLPKVSGLRAAKPNLLGAGKSTQRIVLPGRASTSAPASPSAASMDSGVGGNISLPLGMIMRLLPPEAVTVQAQDFESSAEANQDFQLPLSLIHHQLPTGKIELSVQDLVPYFPRHLLLPDASLAPHLAKTINLPLADVYARIPADLLSLRSDQKQVDAQVMSMADPFTEEILREQAAKARAEAEAKALAEGQTATAVEPEPMVPVLPPPAPLMPPPAPLRSPQPIEVTQKPGEKPFKKTEPLPTAGAPAVTPAPVAAAPVEDAQDLMKLLAAAEAAVGDTATETGTALSAEQEAEAVQALASLQQMEPQPPAVAPVPVALTPVLPTPVSPAPLVPAPTRLAPPPVVPPAPIKPLAEFTPTRPEVELKTLAPTPVPKSVPKPFSKPKEPVTIDLNRATVEEFLKVPELDPQVAEAIVSYRQEKGFFRKLEDLCKVPGLTPSVYEWLTGQEPPEFSAGAGLGEVLGFPDGVEPTLKEVTERISTWPDVAGCVLGSESGLPVAGVVPNPLDVQSLVAYSPKLFSTLNASFKEFANMVTDELVVSHDETGYIFMRDRGTYLVTLIKHRQLPPREMQLLRRVLALIAGKHLNA